MRYRELPIGPSTYIRFNAVSGNALEIVFGNFKYTMQHADDFPRIDLYSEFRAEANALYERWRDDLTKLTKLLQDEAYHIYYDFFDTEDGEDLRISFGSAPWIYMEQGNHEIIAHNGSGGAVRRDRRIPAPGTELNAPHVGLKDSKELVDYIWNDASEFWTITGKIFAIKLLRDEVDRFFAKLLPQDLMLGGRAKISFTEDNGALSVTAERRNIVTGEWHVEYAVRISAWSKPELKEAKWLFENLVSVMELDSSLRKVRTIKDIWDAMKAAHAYYFPAVEETDYDNDEDGEESYLGATTLAKLKNAQEAPKELRVYRRNVIRPVTVYNQDVDVKFSMTGIFEISGATATLLRGEIEMPDGTKREMKAGHIESSFAMEPGNWMGWERVL